MKSRITFKQISKTEVRILLDGVVVGDIWSELEDGSNPYHHDEGHTDSMIQMCGFEKYHYTGNCGRHRGSDLIATFKGIKKCDKCNQELK